MIPADREQRCDAGVAGRCPAARAIALRLASDGLRVAVWDPEFAALEEFIVDNAATRGGLVGYTDLRDFATALHTPRQAVSFPTGPGAPHLALRALFSAADRLIEYPATECTPDELAQIELTLTFLMS
jgi:hypothetical protein